MAIKVESEIGGQSFSLEAGKLAEQADGAVLVRYGDTVVLATAVAKEPREGLDFFPLTIDYEERMYAAGKIPGGFIKRESRPSEAAILAMRLTDRPIRPLFPKGYRNDVQVVLTVLSADQENDPDILAVNGASAALAISPIPFLGPVGAVRVGRIDGQFVTNPTTSQLDESELDLVVAGTRDAVMMVEAGAKILPESVMADAIAYGQQELQKSIDEVYFEARPGKRLTLGISVGAAVFPQDGESYEALLATADSRMYQDKSGRKRRTGRESYSRTSASVLAANTAYPELSDLDIQRAAAGIL